jgi:hypothetical protein
MRSNVLTDFSTPAITDLTRPVSALDAATKPFVSCPLRILSLSPPCRLVAFCGIRFVLFEYSSSCSLSLSEEEEDEDVEEELSDELSCPFEGFFFFFLSFLESRRFSFSFLLCLTFFFSLSFSLLFDFFFFDFFFTPFDEDFDVFFFFFFFVIVFDNKLPCILSSMLIIESTKLLIKLAPSSRPLNFKLMFKLPSPSMALSICASRLRRAIRLIRNSSLVRMLPLLPLLALSSKFEYPPRDDPPVPSSSSTKLRS